MNKPYIAQALELLRLQALVNTGNRQKAALALVKALEGNAR